MSKVRIVVEYQQKQAPNAPVLSTFEIYDVESATLYEALGRIGYADDGRFDVARVVGAQQLPPE